MLPPKKYEIEKNESEKNKNKIKKFGNKKNVDK